MREDYWDGLADSFDDDVFDPVASDFRHTISKAISALSSKKSQVIDIGCGNGRNVAWLAKRFQSVMGLDISHDCLEIAKKQYQHIKNVDFLQLDLTSTGIIESQFDVGVCLNVALMPGFTQRQRLFQAIKRLIRPGGSLIMLLPSVESVLLSVHRHILWNLDDSANYKEASALAGEELGFTAKSLRDGVIIKGGTATKHYLREELEVLFTELGDPSPSIEKVAYKWDTEFDQPPSSMQAPYPWDWLVTASFD